MASHPPLPTLRQKLAHTHRRLIAFAVVLAATTLMFSGLVIVRDYTARNLALIARTASYTAEPALVFGDAAAVRNAVASVAQINGVRVVEVFGGNGRLITRWSPEADALDHRIEAFAFQIMGLPPAEDLILRRGEKIGLVRVTGSTAVLARFLLSGLIIAACCLSITLLATRILARQLEDEIVAPLGKIATIAHAVRTERAFNRRLPSAGIAEVDQFSHDFNALLAELQGWQISLALERDELAWQATHDPLTGLGNRALCERRLEAAVREAVRTSKSFAVLYLDADGFKAINDAHGHCAGDQTLAIIARRITGCIRRGDTAFRIGGDEFTVILGHGVDRQQVDAIMARITTAMEQPIHLPDGREIRDSLSIGAALYPDDGVAPGDLLSHADAVMYQDKNRKRMRVPLRAVVH